MSLSQSSFISAIARISFSHYLYLGLSVRVWVWAVLGLGLAGDDGLHVEADRGHHLSSGHTQLESRKASLKLKWFTVDVLLCLCLVGPCSLQSCLIGHRAPAPPGLSPWRPWSLRHPDSRLGDSRLTSHTCHLIGQESVTLSPHWSVIFLSRSNALPLRSESGSTDPTETKTTLDTPLELSVLIPVTSLAN